MSFEALVLLGCRVEREAKLSAAAARRAHAARDAYLAGLAPLVVTSGGRLWHGVAEADALAAELERGGVPASAIRRERVSLSTFENAIYSERLLRPLGVRRVGIVTCDWHLRRAVRCFSRVGLDAHGVPAHSPRVSILRYCGRALRERLAWWLDPSSIWACRTR